MVFVEIFDLFHMDGYKPTEAFIYFDSSLPKPLYVLIWAYPSLYMSWFEPTQAFICPDLSLPKPTLRQPRVSFCLPRPNGSTAYAHESK